MSNGKAIIIFLTIGLIKKIYYKLQYKISEYFPSYSSKNAKVEFNLEGYATKDDLKNITDVDTSSFALIWLNYRIK